MGSSEELDPFAYLSELGDLIKKASQAFGFSVTNQRIEKEAVRWL